MLNSGKLGRGRGTRLGRRNKGIRANRRTLRCERLETRQLLTGDDVLFADSFEGWPAAPEVAAGWAVQLADGGGVGAVSTNGPQSEQKHLAFTPAAARGSNQSASFVVDLSAQAGRTDIGLDFWAKRSGYSFTGDTLVEVSNDGQQWTTVLTFDPPTEYQRYTVDLDAQPLTLDADVYIRFRHTTDTTCCPQTLWLDEVRVVAGDLSGPQVLSSSPTSLAANSSPPSAISVSFNEPIDGASFTAAAVELRDPQGRLIAVDAPQAVVGTESRQFLITFPPQTVRGQYDLTVGPRVKDLAGNALNQDRDASPGTAADVFRASLSFAPLTIAAGAEPILFAEDFEFTTAAPGGWSFDVVGQGTLLTTDASGPQSGLRHLRFDPGPNNATSQTAAFAIDLAGQAAATNVSLEFRAKTLGAAASGQLYVEISHDGLQWQQVASLDPPAEYQRYVFDLDGQGVPLDEATYLRFRHLTTTTCCPNDVFLDNVRITTSDAAGPRVTGHSPSAALVGPLATIQVTFSEPIDAASFTAGDVVLRDPLNRVLSLAGDPQDAGDGRTWTLQPAEPLRLGGRYALAIGPDVRDLAGNAINQDSDTAIGESQGDDTYFANLEIQAVPTATVPYFQGFDSLTGLGQHWSFGADPGGRIQLVSDAGRRVLRMDSTGVWAKNEAVLSLDLTGRSGLRLLFEDNNPSDESHEADGVYISDNGGATWYRVDPLSASGTQWTRHEIDLDAAIATAGISYGPDFCIAFRQYDNWPWANDGRQLDNVRVTADATSPAVLSATPDRSLTTTDEFNQITFHFSEPIDPATFDLSDVKFTGPSGDLTAALLGVASVPVEGENGGPADTFTVSFQEQTAFGRYEMSIGPEIRDFGGNPLDQNGNGLVAEPSLDRFTATIDILQPVRLPYSQNFSNGLPTDAWVFYSTGNGRIQIANGGLRMDSASGFALNEAILHLDLAGATNVRVEFDHTNPADETHHDGLHVGDVFTAAHRNADLIALSDNGGVSWQVAALLEGSGRILLDLDSLIAAGGLNYTRNFQVKLQQYDNSPYAGDGRIFDNLVVNSGTLTLAVAADAINENGGPAATTATLTRSNASLAAPLVVRLSNSDSSSVAAPAEITIPAGQAAVTFDLGAIDNTVVEGRRTVSFSADAPGFVLGSDSLLVHDDEPATLILRLPATQVGESAGTLTATVTRNRNFSGSLPVTLTASDLSELRVPATVTIPTGADSVSFTVQIVNDGDLDGPQAVSLTATATNWAAASTMLTVNDDDQENSRTIGGPIAGVLPAADFLVTGDLTVAGADTLTVAPGSTLRFNSGTQLLVQGTLLADAADGAPIRFTSAAAVPAAGAWQGIRFNNGGRPQSVLHRVEVAFATTGVRIEPTATLPRVHIRDSDLHDHSGDGVRIATDSAQVIAAADVQIVGNRIHNNGGYGVALTSFHSGCNNTDNGAAVLGNEIAHNAAGGIYAAATASAVLPCIPVRNGGVSAAIEGNFVHDNLVGVEILSARSKEQQNNTVITTRLANNRIVGNSGDGVRLTAASAFATLNPVLVNNTIVGNGGSGVWHSAAMGGGFVLQNNIVATNGAGVSAAAAFTPAAGAVGFNDAFGNTAANWTNYPSAFGSPVTTNANGTPADAEQNIAVDPQFLPDSDYRLSLDSPAIDAALAVHAPSNDFDGEPRSVPIDIGADEVRGLILLLDRDEIRESETEAGASGTLWRFGGDLQQPLLVSLASSDPSEASVPGGVTFAPGARFVEFDISPIDNTLLDGPRTVTISATAEDFGTVQVALLIADHETLSVELADSSISEAGGQTTATVSRNNTDLGQPLLVRLSALGDDSLDLPPTAIIPAGQASVSFALAAIDDSRLDGRQTLVVAAAADGYVPAGTALDVLDFEQLALNIDAASVLETAGANATTGRITRLNTNWDLPLEVTLMNGDASEIGVPVTVTIPAGESSATFPIAAVYDLIPDGNHVASITATAAGYANAPAASLTVIDVNNWHNPLNPLDVDADGLVSAADVLVIVNYLNEHGAGPLPPLTPAGETSPESGAAMMLDTSGDDRLTALDALLVVNHINTALPATGEGEGAAAAAAPANRGLPASAETDWTDNERSFGTANLSPATARRLAAEWRSVDPPPAPPAAASAPADFFDGSLEDAITAIAAARCSWDG